MRVAICGLFLLLALACPGLRAETAPLSPLELKPLAALTTYAAAHGIAIQGVEFAAGSASSRPGDEVVYLMALQQGDSLKQWIVRLVADSPDAQKGETKPLSEDTIFTSTGLELHYTNSPAAVNVEFIGPFDAGTVGEAKAKIARGRAVVSAESLKLGLVHYCAGASAIAQRLKDAGIEHPLFYGRGQRPTPAEVEAGRKGADAFQLKAEEERLAFSVYFALRSFYSAATQIPACRDVLEQVLQKPSLWSIAGNLGVNTNFQYGWHEVIRVNDGLLPVPAPIYALPVRLSLNDKPALNAMIAVATTQSPLRTCAGIVSLVAEHPTTPSRRVILNLLSAHPAKS